MFRRRPVGGTELILDELLILVVPSANVSVISVMVSTCPLSC